MHVLVRGQNKIYDITGFKVLSVAMRVGTQEAVVKAEMDNSIGLVARTKEAPITIEFFDVHAASQAFNDIWEAIIQKEDHVEVAFAKYQVRALVETGHQDKFRIGSWWMFKDYDAQDQHDHPDREPILAKGDKVIVLPEYDWSGCSGIKVRNEAGLEEIVFPEELGPIEEEETDA